MSLAVFFIGQTLFSEITIIPFESVPKKSVLFFSLYCAYAIKEFLVYALANYEMELVGPEELLLKLAFTAVLEEPVNIIFKKLIP